MKKLIERIKNAVQKKSPPENMSKSKDVSIREDADIMVVPILDMLNDDTKTVLNNNTSENLIQDGPTILPEASESGYSSDSSNFDGGSCDSSQSQSCDSSGCDGAGGDDLS